MCQDLDRAVARLVGVPGGAKPVTVARAAFRCRLNDLLIRAGSGLRQCKTRPGPHKPITIAFKIDEADLDDHHTALVAYGATLLPDRNRITDEGRPTNSTMTITPCLNATPAPCKPASVAKTTNNTPPQRRPRARGASSPPRPVGLRHRRRNILAQRVPLHPVSGCYLMWSHPVFATARSFLNFVTRSVRVRTSKSSVNCFLIWQ